MSPRPAAPASASEKRAWLRLIRSENIGPITFRELLGHFGNAEAALAALPALARSGRRTAGVASADDAEREMDAAEAMGARLLALGEPDYPAWLAAIDDAPPIITMRGDARCFARPAVAIVGSRNASVAGQKLTRQIAAELGTAGIVVASGLARGIDAAAHRAALAAGTIAVFAGGLDRPYPPEHAALAEEIVAAGGSILSEMPLGWEPRARDFPRRNRIVSGLSVAVVVVEGALRSGTLITARRAADQGRLVFAVPGSPLDPRAGATNLLIKEGATIVTSVDDIVAEVQPMLVRERHPPWPAPDDLPLAAEMPPEAASDGDHERVLAALSRAPVEIDDLIRFTGLSPAVIHLALIELDISGRLARHQGGRVSLLD